jgi:MFS superfamily sulfate permease-like transporter
MEMTQYIKKLRGWFPKEPTRGIIQNAKNNQMPSKRVMVPFLAAGAITIIAALLSVFLGIRLVDAYRPGSIPPDGTTFYSGFYAGILSLAAFAVGLVSAVLLLLRKRVVMAATGMMIVLVFGLVVLVIPLLEGLTWSGSLLVASPMIVSSVVTLIIVAINYRKVNSHSDSNRNSVGV